MKCEKGINPLGCFLNPNVSGNIYSTTVPPGQTNSCCLANKDLTKNSNNSIRLFHTRGTPLFIKGFFRRGPPGGIEAILLNYAFWTIIKEEGS